MKSVQIIAFKLALLMGVGCSEPFPTGRQDLIEPRIIGVRTAGEMTIVQVWNGTANFHENFPKVEWMTDQGQVFGEGPMVSSVGIQGGSLIYTTENGGKLEAVFDVVDNNKIIKLQRYSVNFLNQYDLGYRLSLAGDLIEDHHNPDEIRLVSNVDSGSSMRWMTALGVGTILELDNQSTDFIRKNITFDRDEIIQEENLSEMYASIFALSTDGEGKNQWSWLDLWFEPTRSVRHAARYVPIDVELSNPAVLSVLVHSDDTAFGFRFSEPVFDEVVEPLSCAPTDGSFQWWWVEVGLCLRSDLDGERINLEVY